MPCRCRSSALGNNTVERVIRRYPPLRALPRQPGAAVQLEPLLVANVEKLGGARLGDAYFLEDRTQTRTKCFELRVGCPDLAHLEVARRSKTDMVFKAVGRPMACLVQTTLDLVVLFSGQGRGCEADQRTHRGVLSTDHELLR